jgi:hypothetical protein
MHRLTELFDRLSRDIYPPRDDEIEIVGPPPGVAGAVMAFPNHNVIATSLDPDAVRAEFAPEDLKGPLRPSFLNWMREQLDARPTSVDIVLYAKGRGVGSDLVEPRDDLYDHPRVIRASRYRDEIELYGDPVSSSVLVIGSGVAGRREIAVEVPASQRKASTGRRLVQAALDITPRGVPVFAQVASGNAASLRAFYNSGFRPLGAEALFIR